MIMVPAIFLALSIAVTIHALLTWQIDAVLPGLVGVGMFAALTHACWMIRK